MEVIEFGLKERDKMNPYLVPAIIYGKGMENISIALDRKEFKQLIKNNGRNIVLNCTLPDGKKITTVIKEIQKDVVTFEPYHVDFMALSTDQEITITVPVRLQNKEQCAGVKNGGRLQFVLFKVKISGKPEHLPREINLDVTNLDIGNVLYTRDLILNEGVTMISPYNLKVAGIFTRNAQLDEEAESSETPATDTKVEETPTTDKPQK